MYKLCRWIYHTTAKNWIGSIFTEGIISLWVPENHQYSGCWDRSYMHNIFFKKLKLNEGMMVNPIRY